MRRAVRSSAIQVMRHVPSTPARRHSVTVFVSCYNYAHYLRESVGSALAQRDVDVQVFIFDDGSSDDTPAVSARLAADARVTVVRNDPNIGQLPSFNAAIEMTTSEFFVKLDADDVLPPGSLARSVALMEAHPEVNFVYGLPVHFSGPTPEIPETPAKSWTLWQGQEWFARRCRRGDNGISQPEVLMRTDALRRVGPIREYLPHTFDQHLWMQLAATGDVGRVNGPPQGYYREHDQSMQRTIHSGVVFRLQARMAAFDSVFEAEGGRLPDAEALHDSAKRALASEALELACRAYDRDAVDREPVEELVRFAADAYPRYQELRWWRALERRRAGANPVLRRIRRVTDALRRRVAWQIGHRRWERTGEW